MILIHEEWNKKTNVAEYNFSTLYAYFATVHLFHHVSCTLLKFFNTLRARRVVQNIGEKVKKKPEELKFEKRS